MQELKTTGPGQIPQSDRHYHIVYINSETGAAAMAPAKDGHTHQLIYDPPREPVEPTPAVPPQVDPMTGMPMMIMDPATGQMMPDPGQPENPGDPGKEVGTWLVQPGGASPETFHDHEVIDYKPQKKDKKQPDKEVLEECLSLWREALAITEDSRRKGRESEDFYAGKQWEDEVSRKMQGLDRAALTINEIAPNIDTLIGYQIEQRTDIRYLPQGGGDQRVADMTNIVAKKILDNCAFHREETKVFKDVVVPGFGNYNIYMNFANNIQGEPVIERFPWDDRHYGPHEKEDLSDCEYDVSSRMQSIAKLKQMFGKKAEEIEVSYKSYAGQYPDVDMRDSGGVNGTNTDYQHAKKLDDMPFTVDGTFPLVDVQKKQLRLAQVARKIYKEVTVIFNQEENFFHTAYDWKDEDIASASSLPGFQVVSQLKPRMRITKFCGNVILSDENPADLPVHDFFSVPVYCYRQNGEYWGKVESAKDPQREINKRRSQLMDTMNRLGASVYYVEPETFTSPTEKENFKKKRSRPGSVFDVNDINRKPVLEEGADVPQALVQIMQLDQQNLQRLMNVVVYQEGANESGELFLEKKKGRITGNQFIFDNMSFAKQKIGKILLALMQRYYPAERMQKMLDSEYSKQQFKIGGQDYSTFSKDEIIEMLESADLLEYDVIVAESSFAPSTRIAIAKVLFDLIKQGANVPPELPLEFVDMPSDTRLRITDSLQQQAQASAQAATDAGNSELAKTVVANGTYTIAPEKAQEMGLVPVPGAVQNAALPGGAAPANNGAGTTQDTTYADQLAGALAG